MTEPMRYRGPDGIRHEARGPAAFGHLMLHTTPESLRETQPLAGPDGRTLLAADARLDNRESLLPALGLDERATDADVILAAYDRWGADCPKHFVGDFAFALWDDRREELLCVRDHFGIRSFYYVYEPGAFAAFATEMKGLLALDEVSGEVREARVADFLLLELKDAAATPYQGMHRLPPAHTLRITKDRATLAPYWTLDPDRDVVLDSDEAYVAEFRRLFEQAVRARMRTAFPIGSHLSGGMDSSSVAVVAREVLRERGGLPLPTISSRFETVLDSDEREFYETVIAQGDIAPHYVALDAYGPLSEWEELAEVEDDIYTGGNHYLIWYLKKTSAEAGLRVVLDGMDGDTVVSHGMPYVSELALQGRWTEMTDLMHAMNSRFEGPVHDKVLDWHVYPAIERLRRARRWGTLVRGLRALQRAFGVPFRRSLFHHVLKKELPAPVLGVLRRLTGRRVLGTLLTQQPGGTVLDIVNPAFRARMEAERTASKLDVEAFMSVREEQVAALGSAGLTADVAETYGRMAAYFGVEVRHPFMDVRLIEFIVGIPGRLRLKDGWPRWILRAALADLLPEKIQKRTSKASMEHNFHFGITVRDRARFDRIIAEDLDRYAHYINVPVVREMYHRITTNPKFYSHESSAVWRAAILVLLLDRAAERRAAKHAAAPLAA